MKEFFDECYRMKAFKHPNVVELIGMCLDSPDGFPLMILPLYPNGNLKAYLQKSRGVSRTVTRMPAVRSTIASFNYMYIYVMIRDIMLRISCCKSLLVSNVVFLLLCYLYLYLGLVYFHSHHNVSGHCTRNGVFG